MQEPNSHGEALRKLDAHWFYNNIGETFPEVIKSFDGELAANEEMIMIEKQSKKEGVKEHWCLLECVELMTQLVALGAAPKGPQGWQVIVSALSEIRPGRKYTSDNCASSLKRLVAKFNRVNALAATGMGHTSETPLGEALISYVELKAEKAAEKGVYMYVF
jgi:hypothetical protein